MGKACGGSGAGLCEFNGEDDHVHPLVQHPPKVAAAGLANSRKGVPTRRLRAQFTGRMNRRTMTATSGPVLHRRILRRCATEHHPAVHRAAKNTG